MVNNVDPIDEANRLRRMGFPRSAAAHLAIATDRQADAEGIHDAEVVVALGRRSW